MTDLVTRLRRWAIATDAVPASDLMDEAADEIERLRLGIATQTDRDAAPAAKASADRDRTDRAAARPGEGTGDTLCPIAKRDTDSSEPSAYAVYLNQEYDSSYGPDAIDEAMEIAAECNGELVPLYAAPPTQVITATERHCLEKAVILLADSDEVPLHQYAAVLHTLAQRTSKPHATPSDDSVQAGCTREPVAWAVWSDTFGYPFGDAAIFKRNELAVEMCVTNGYGVDDIIPLYRQPTLSDEEMAAIQWAADTLCVGWSDLKPDDRDRSRKAVDALRRLLERVG